MKNRTEVKNYLNFANDLAEQFESGENVDAGNIAYLKSFSPDSRTAYDYLMDRIAGMYEVTPLDSFISRIGHLALSHLEQ